MVRRKSNAEIRSVSAQARWQPEDDLKLVTAIEQINDLATVHSAITFSCYFTIDELSERWNQLLFNREVSLASQEEISLLPFDHRLDVIRQAALFSEEENEQLQSCGLNRDLAYFKQLLDIDNGKNSKVFHSSRTAWCLFRQWQLLHSYRLLHGQVVPHPAHSRHHQDVSQLRTDRAESPIEPEEEIHARWNRKQILKLEAQIRRLEGALQKANEDCIAKVEGEFVSYAIGSEKTETIIGRGEETDVDLSRERGSGRIHRKHAVIVNKGDGTFKLKNLGQRKVVVNGVQLRREDETELPHHSLIQLDPVDLIFSLT